MAEQIRLRTLLAEDQFFKGFFSKAPAIPGFHTTPPWRLFVQNEENGRWGRVDLPTYAKAYSQVKMRLPTAWDMAIHCKPARFSPPTIKTKVTTYYIPMPPGHGWCELCRRPVIFKSFRVHPNLRLCLNDVVRCTICGMAQERMNRYHSKLTWPVKLKG